ncbi:MAG: MiaB/RimO family radical SAM methylthiotransferase [Dehalococcoidia bacterium]|nr:MiaB/RimO family radical SAM methylthiotransferase [Dehalococcoidia bacterium]
MMGSYYIWTIGCQMNRAESERLSVRFRSHGYMEAPNAEAADVVVVNSCVVRKHAEDKVFNKLHNLKALKKRRPDMRIVLTGCFVGQTPAELQALFPYVDDFLRPGEFPDWLPETDCAPVVPVHPAVSAYVPIIQGCNNFCTYCVVPYRRGREKSRLPEDIICEVRRLVQHGIKEVILVGQNVDSYGHDLQGCTNLAQLLTELNGIEGLSRLRFLTNHPKDMTQTLIDAVACLDKVCRQINLPVQSGNDDILRAMNRGYTVADYRDLMLRLRRVMPDIAITTDVIVGFPGEDDTHFQNTYELLTELRFDAVHVAAYSPRPGTLAANRLVDDVPQDTKKARLAAVESLQARIASEINAAYLGQTLEVLVDGTNKSRWQGRTRSDKMVFFSSAEDLQGKTVLVQIGKTSPWSLQGKLNTPVAEEIH